MKNVDFSLKISNAESTSGSTFIQYTFSEKELRKAKGKHVTAVMRFLRADAYSNIQASGRVNILIDGVNHYTYQQSNLPVDGFYYKSMTAEIPSDATSIKVNFYGDSSALGAEVSISAMGIYIGKNYGEL